MKRARLTYDPDNPRQTVEALILGTRTENITLTTGPLSEKERAILAAGCMINDARQGR